MILRFSRSQDARPTCQLVRLMLLSASECLAATSCHRGVQENMQILNRSSAHVRSFTLRLAAPAAIWQINALKGTLFHAVKGMFTLMQSLTLSAMAQHY